MIRIALFILFVITVVSGCKEKTTEKTQDASPSFNATPYKYGQKGRSVSMGDEAFLFKLPDHIKATDLNIKAVVVNQSRYKAIAGDNSYLQILKNQQWETIPKSYIYTSIGYEIADGDSMSFNCELDMLEGEPEHAPGTYRLCKDILIQPEIVVSIDTTATSINLPNHSLIKISVNDSPLHRHKGAFILNIENRSRHELQITELGYFRLMDNHPEENYHVQTTTTPRQIQMPAYSTLPLRLPLRDVPNMNPFKPGLYSLHLNITVTLTHEFEIKHRRRPSEKSKLASNQVPTSTIQSPRIHRTVHSLTSS